MKDWGRCERCGDYADLARHQQYTKLYEARLDGEEEWRPTCGDYYPHLEDSTDGPKTAAERFCQRMDAEESYIVREDRTVRVRHEGDAGEGQAIQVETRMVPEYHGQEMSPCSNGCGRLTTVGGKCHTCMMEEIRAAKAATEATEAEAKPCR